MAWRHLPSRRFSEWLSRVSQIGNIGGIALSLGALMTSCASREPLQTQALEFDLSGLQGNALTFESSCFAISVTAPDISASADPSGFGLGVTSFLFPGSQGSISLDVPIGTDRTIRLYRYIGGSCDPTRRLSDALLALNEADACSGNILLEEIASTRTDLLGSQSVGLTVHDSTLVDPTLANALTASARCLAYNNGVVPSSPPMVTSITRATVNPSRAGVVAFNVTFSESVTGVDASDFTVFGTAAASGAITLVSGSGSTYTVTLSAATPTGTEGTVRLDLDDNDSILSANTGKPLGGLGAQDYKSGQSFNLDEKAPDAPTFSTLSSAVKTTTANFNYSNAEIGATIDLYFDGPCGVKIATVSPAASSGSFTLALGGADGPYALSFKVSDVLGNQSSCASSGVSVTKDTIAPTVTSFVRGDSDPTSNGILSFDLTFSEAVTGVAASQFSLISNPGLAFSDSGVLAVSGSGTSYTILLSVGTGTGSLMIQALNGGSGDIQDSAGNPLAAVTFTASQFYTVQRNRATVSFSTAGTYLTSALASPTPIELTLSSPLPSDVTVTTDVLPTLTSATSGDYTPNTTPVTVTIPANQMTASLTLSANVDVTVPPGDRGKILAYGIRSTSDPRVIPGDLSTHRVTIINSANVSQGNFSQVSTNVREQERHSCGVASAGKIFCWGNNHYAQLGDGTTISRPRPTLLNTGATTYLKVKTGGAHTCAIASTSNLLTCWGSNSNGQVGSGSIGAAVIVSTPATPNALSAVSILDVAMGDEHTCALKTDGTVHCWGKNDSGQIGIGSTAANTPLPSALATAAASIPGATFSQVSAGQNHTCALATGALLGQLYCWGSNALGQLGNGNTTSSNIPVRVGAGAGMTFTAVTTGANHTCGIGSGANTGKIFCWGSNISNQVGGSGSTILTPFGVDGTVTYSTVSAGGNHTCAIRTDNSKLYCWGSNETGQLGLGSHGNLGGPTPAIVAPSTTYIAVTAGFAHTCAITVDGKTQCWGSNAGGQIGDTVAAIISSPALLDTRVPITSLELGKQSYACGLTTGNTLQCWGHNRQGQLGNFTQQMTLSPTSSDPGVNFASISPGVVHACGITTVEQGSKLRCWGSNSKGQLGDGTTTQRLTPQTISPSDTFQQVAAGGGFTCAINSLNNLQCWGANSVGQLGDGTTTQRVSPVAVDAGTTYSSVSASFSTSATLGAACGITSAGFIKCWGANDQGQLGIGTTVASQPLPSLIASSSTFASVSFGENHVCAIGTSATGSGPLFCWGNNGSGRLGNGTTTNQRSPVTIQSGTNFSKVSLGTTHTCAIAQSQDLYCWGANTYGQLGDGTLVSKNIPVLVGAGFTDVKAGDRQTCGKIASGGAWKCWGDFSYGTIGTGLGQILAPIFIW